MAEFALKQTKFCWQASHILLGLCRFLHAELLISVACADNLQKEALTMKCPVCRSVDLLMSDRNGIEIDYCPTCRGVWLDRGELDKIIERATAGGYYAQPAPP